MIRVLITDDEPLVRQGLRMILSTLAGLEVTGEAKDGEEAIEKALQLRPDLLIMDVRLPGKDGISAAADIKRLLPDALIIVISIEGGMELRERASSAGAFAFAEKSGGQASLLQEVTRAVQFINSRNL